MFQVWAVVSILRTMYFSKTFKSRYFFRFNFYTTKKEKKKTDFTCIVTIPQDNTAISSTFRVIMKKSVVKLNNAYIYR